MGAKAGSINLDKTVNLESSEVKHTSRGLTRTVFAANMEDFLDIEVNYNNAFAQVSKILFF